MRTSPIHRLRIIGIIEGISFLVLLGIAMPLKYLADRPEAVKVVGWAHGILFMLFCAALLLAMRAARWGIPFAALVFFMAWIPCGPFLIDGRLKREAQKVENGETGQ